MGVLHWPFDPSGLRPKKISVRFLVLQGAERPASACAKKIGFETLTIVFLVQNFTVCAHITEVCPEYRFRGANF